MTANSYDKKVLLGLYSLARNYYLCGFFEEAENLCGGLLSLNEKDSCSRLLHAAIQFEKGNYSLAANSYRIASQDAEYFNQSRVGILACVIAQKDMNRGRNLAEEIDKDTSSFSPELKAYFEEITSQL